ncbi:MAG: SNF2-related protein [Verrucomicrobiales bacterium]|nr:SNF2-related protein [Verrucomicrobiales bacterium]
MPPKEPATAKLPATNNWRTTDTDEITRRQIRAREESFNIANTDPQHPIYSNFCVKSASGLSYSVEIRDLQQRHFACDCVDFRINGLGTCKHVESVLLHLEARFRRLFTAAGQDGSRRIEVLVDPARDTLRVLNGHGELPRALEKWFDDEHRLANGSPEAALAAVQQLREGDYPQIRISQEVGPWLENRRQAAERKQLRHKYELKVQSGEWPAQETKVPLFPYQRDGMLHLAFTERALLADEMGLGKTIQAIAACALLHRLGRAQRVLVVTPASLKTEWEEQIQRFTDHRCQLVFGGRTQRLKAYTPPALSLCSENAPHPSRGHPFPVGQGEGRGEGSSSNPPDVVEDEIRGGSSSGQERMTAGPGEGATFDPQIAASNFPFFTIVNYEQMVIDALEVNERLRPDVVVLDEAQRIKNWNTKTAQAIKRLRSRYAFVLTGTPIENRIDELHSLMDFLNPTALGPLFRFNRDFYELDDRGRPIGYRNLDQLHARIRPYMLRRRKAEVETELPERTDKRFFVRMSDEQKENYASHEQQVLRLVNVALRRPLTQQEHERLQRELAMMRMICDTNYILDPDDRVCPKLAELEKILEDCRANDAKAIIFSEWERMLELVRELCDRRRIGYAWHTGRVPQQRRRGEINLFKSDPNCRVFLSTDSGATGLNLQNASVVINCDLPWNPAKLEQRIARAWRKHQTKPVTVINLISENTIEHRMLDTLATKQAIAESVLDHPGKVKEIKLRGGRQAFVARLQQLVTKSSAGAKPEIRNPKLNLPSDRAMAFAQLAGERINGAMVRCEERYPQTGSHSVLVVVVDRDAPALRERLAALHGELFGPGKTDPLAPTQIEVIDRATDEAIQRLLAAGLIAKTTRASRSLFPAEDALGPAALSAEERAKAEVHRQLAARKLKMARVLGDTGFAEEARPALLEAIHAFGRAYAVEGRLPEPSGVNDTLVPPLSHHWQDALPIITRFVNDAAGDWKELAGRLAGM